MGAALCVLALAAPPALANPQPSSASADAAATVLYAAPSGSGSACTQAVPCSLPRAQQAARTAQSSGATDVAVQLADGTYRLTAPLQFDSRDSGTSGHPVVWSAAPGAHPVISGASQVTGWTQVGTTGVWSATVPAGSDTRQLYINGAEAPIARATPSQLGFAGGWTGSSTGYDLGSDTTAIAWFGSLTAAQVAQVEFNYPGGNGAWTDSSCRAASYANSVVTMVQPCWTNTTNRLQASQNSGGLPAMSSSQPPSTIENARSLLHAGQWYLDSAANTLYYQPISGQSMTGLDVELPRLETLLQGAGTLADPLHDVTFSGLQFSYATWNEPSTNVGFSEVQGNLRMTLPGNNQGGCTFTSPAGSCPWGSLTQPKANVDFTASDNITLTGNRFVNLGGAGLGIRYGSSHNLVQGNEFTGIASTAILLGCTYDPTPTAASDAAGIKANCAVNPAAASDTIGTNEIMSDNTISDNVIHRAGTDYPGAAGITLLFSQHTIITHNDIYDLPYTGITAGIVQGHIDMAAHPQNATNINSFNTISYNTVHDIMQTLGDGGAIYMEGHQAQYVYQADGTTIDPVATLANGLQVIGNVAYNIRGGWAFYDDAGSEWINIQGNAGFKIGAYTQGGCSATGHFWVTGNYGSQAFEAYLCNQPVDTHASGNTTIPDQPQPGDIPAALLSSAGLTAPYRAVSTALGPKLSYASAATTGTTPQALIAGEGFSASTPVYFGDQLATAVQFVSQGFLIATVPAGADSTDVGVGQPVAQPVMTSPVAGSVGLPATIAVRGSGVAGDAVAVADSRTSGTACVATVDSDATWSCTISGAATGWHTLTAVQTDPAGTNSKPSAAVVVSVGTPPTATRINDDDPAIAYDSNWTYTTGRSKEGDYQSDIHSTRADGAALSYTFVGTGIKVFGELSGDQGNIGVSIDSGAPVTVSTLPTVDREGNVAVFSQSGLTPGAHSVTITKLSGTYSTMDGFEIDYNVAPPVVSVVSSPSAPNGSNGWYTGPVTLTASASDAMDPNPVVSAQIDGGDWAQVSGPIVLGTDGVHTVGVRATNVFAITSAPTTTTVKIDATPPVSNATVDATARTVTVRAADETSGVAQVDYQLPGGTWTTYSGPITVGSAATTIDFRAIDKAGNVEPTNDVTVPRAGTPLQTSVTKVTPTSASVVAGKKTTLKITVVGSGAAPTGSVRITDGSTLLGTATLVNGKATYSVAGSALGVGQQTLTLTYDGDQTYDVSSASAVVTVVPRQGDGRFWGSGKLGVFGSA